MKQTPLKRKPMKRTQPTRDWTAAREKVEAEGRCRICGDPGDALAALEAAHIVGREHDEPAPCPRCEGLDHYGQRCPRCKGTGFGKTLFVHPDRIVPLCRRMGGGCHPAYDAHELDLLGHLTPEEEAQAVLDADGLELARRRLCPTDYRSPAPSPQATPGETRESNDLEDPALSGRSAAAPQRQTTGRTER